MKHIPAILLLLCASVYAATLYVPQVYPHVTNAAAVARSGDIILMDALTQTVDTNGFTIYPGVLLRGVATNRTFIIATLGKGSHIIQATTNNTIFGLTVRYPQSVNPSSVLNFVILNGDGLLVSNCAFAACSDNGYKIGRNSKFVDCDFDSGWDTLVLEGLASVLGCRFNIHDPPCGISATDYNAIRITGTECCIISGNVFSVVSTNDQVIYVTGVASEHDDSTCTNIIVYNKFILDGVTGTEVTPFRGKMNAIIDHNIVVRPVYELPNPPVVTNTVTLSTPATGAILIGAGSYTNGSTVTVQAIGAQNWVFLNWTEGTATVSTMATYTFTLTANRSLVAHFGPSADSWTKLFGGPGEDMGYSLAKDKAGNIYATGHFTGTAKFGGIPLVSAGGKDIFVLKLSPAGDVLSAQRFGGTGDDGGLGIAVDAAGDVILAGYFSLNTEFGTAVSGTDGFIAKLTGSTGAVQWSKRIGGISAFNPDEQCTSVSVDSAGNVVVTGYASGVLNFGGGQVFTPGLARCSFLAKYNSAGAYQWAQLTGPIVGGQVACDLLDSIYQTRVNAGGQHTVNKFSPSGVGAWSVNVTNAFKPAINGLTVTSNRVFIAGQFAGTLALGNNVTVTSTNTSSAAFLAAYNLSGEAQWARAATTTTQGYDSTGQAVAVDTAGNPFVTGPFLGTVSFGGNALNTRGGRDIYLWRLTAAGVTTGVEQYGGPGVDIGYGATWSGSPIIVGTTQGFPGQPSAGGYDVFIGRGAP